jgi:hypothetical protein
MGLPGELRHRRTQGDRTFQEGSKKTARRSDSLRPPLSSFCFPDAVHVSLTTLRAKQQTRRQDGDMRSNMRYFQQFGMFFRPFRQEAGTSSQ